MKSAKNFMNDIRKKLFDKNHKHKFRMNEVFELLFYVIITIILYLLIRRIDAKKTLEFFVDKISPSSKVGVDRIDGVIYINLEERDDRKKLIIEEMKKMKLPDKKINKVSGIYIPKNGHKGCIQAHLLALRIAKMNNWKNTLILEDDAELSCNPEEFQSRLEKVFKYLETNEFKNKYEKWDVIMMSTANLNKSDTDNDNIVKINFATLGTSYIVNNHYLDRMINLFEYCNQHMPYDKWGDTNGHEPYALDQKWGELQKTDNWFMYKENLINQRNIWSTTNNRGNKPINQ